jgi:protease IV
MDSSAANPDPQTPILAQTVPSSPSWPPAEPIRVRIEPPGVWTHLLRFVPWIVVVIVLFSAAWINSSSYLDGEGQIHEKFHSLNSGAQDKIAIITVDGLIVSGDGFVKRQIDRVKADERVKAVVLRVNSPGGTVSGSDHIFEQLRKLVKDRKLPMVVSMGPMATSGGYYIAMAAGAQEEIGWPAKAQGGIFAERTTFTGSIGVIIPHYNLSGMLADWKIENDSVKSHEHKDMLAMTRPMTETERAKVQVIVNESFDRFKEVIRYGRRNFRQNPSELDVLATGEIFTARQAIEHGLIDREGFLEDAIDEAVRLAGLLTKDVRVVRYEAPKSLVDALAGTSTATRGQVDPAAALLELSTPRPYYLWSWLPSAAGPRAE